MTSQSSTPSMHGRTRRWPIRSCGGVRRPWQRTVTSSIDSSHVRPEHGMFFQSFMHWLGGQLHAYVSVQVGRVAAALTPMALVLATVYVMAWGYLHLRGAIAEPLVEGIRRLITLGVILGAALHLWLYHDVLIVTFLDGPAELAAAMVGAADPVATVDVIWDKGGSGGDTLWNRGGVFNGDPGYYFAGAAVWLVVGLVCIYCVFLLALAQIA